MKVNPNYNTKESLLELYNKPLLELVFKLGLPSSSLKIPDKAKVGISKKMINNFYIAHILL